MYWGTVVAAEIEDHIQHEPDNATLGRVEFGPWADAEHDQQYGTGIAVETTDLPASFALLPNHPNPFNPATIIRYDLPAPTWVRITVVDVADRRLATLVERPEPAGSHGLRWDASGLASGVYFCRLEAGSYVETRTMTLLR